MGSGGSKKKQKKDKSRAPTISPVQELTNENQFEQQVLDDTSRRSSANKLASPRPSTISNHGGDTNIPIGSRPASPLHELDTNTFEENGNLRLSPTDNQGIKSKSPPTTRPSSFAPPPVNHRPSRSSTSSSATHKHSHGRSSVSSHGGVPRCTHCPHCQRMNKLGILPDAKTKWITRDPGTGPAHINMDEYDIEAVKEKIIDENGHLPGCYDYQPQLTIEQTNDYDAVKENYYTQPVIAKTSPRVAPARTPFPEYDNLQRREQRLNKPYSQPLFVD